MKWTKIGLGFLSIISWATFFPTLSHLKAAEPPGVSVLFIGNSFTYCNDLPKMLSDLAKAGKQPLMHCEQETPGGCTLEKHWKDGKALAKIRSRHWNFVILQDQSQAPLHNRQAMFDYGKKFDAEIRKQGAKTVLYMTWAGQKKPEDQAAISKAYLDLSKELKAKIAPVGQAWETALKADKKLVLHDKDGRHPNVTGSYLAACVFYATIYGQSPEGFPGSIGKLTDVEARPLQAIVWKTVRKE